MDQVGSGGYHMGIYSPFWGYQVSCLKCLAQSVVTKSRDITENLCNITENKIFDFLHNQAGRIRLRSPYSKESISIRVGTLMCYCEHLGKIGTLAESLTLMFLVVPCFDC